MSLPILVANVGATNGGATCTPLAAVEITCSNRYSDSPPWWSEIVLLPFNGKGCTPRTKTLNSPPIVRCVGKIIGVAASHRVAFLHTHTTPYTGASITGHIGICEAWAEAYCCDNQAQTKKERNGKSF